MFRNTHDALNHSQHMGFGTKLFFYWYHNKNKTIADALLRPAVTIYLHKTQDTLTKFSNAIQKC